MRRHGAGWMLGGLVCLALATPAIHADALRGAVIGAGATPASGIAGSGSVMYGTVGQPVSGESGTGTTRISYGYWSFGGPRVLAVDEGGGDDGGRGPQLPSRLEFGLARPNPAMGPVRFSLALPSASQVAMIVLDVQGRLLSRVNAGRLDAGVHDITWDTRGVRAGVHFVRLVVDGREAAMRRVVVIR